MHVSASSGVEPLKLHLPALLAAPERQLAERQERHAAKGQLKGKPKLQLKHCSAKYRSAMLLSVQRSFALAASVQAASVQAVMHRQLGYRQ